MKILTYRGKQSALPSSCMVAALQSGQAAYNVRATAAIALSNALSTALANALRRQLSQAAGHRPTGPQ